MNEGTRIAREIARRSRALEELARQTKQRKQEIRENTDLTSEARTIETKKLQKSALATHQKLTSEIATLQERARRWAKHVRVSRPVDDAARERVTTLLGRGTAHDRIIERALQLGDTETIAALRWEVLYHGDRHGFANADATIEACDRALAEIAPEDEGGINRGLVRLREVDEPVEAVAAYAGKVALDQDTPHDLLTFAFATGAGRGENDA